MTKTDRSTVDSPHQMPKSSQYRNRMNAFFARPKPRAFVKFGMLWAVTFAALMSFFLNRILHSHNYLEIFPNEVIFPTAMHIFTSFVVALIMYWCRPLKTFAAKLLSALVLTLLFVGYDEGMLVAGGLIQAFLPGVTSADSTSTLSAIYLIMLIAIAILTGVGYGRLQKKYPRIEHKSVWVGLLIITGYLFILPAFTVVKVFPAMVAQSRVQAPEFETPKTAHAPDGKPDIYYFVLDRYTNNDVLQTQFNFDNSKFTDYLEDNDFYVNKKAQSSYPYTTSSVASTLVADYTKSLVQPFVNDPTQSKTLYHNLIWQSPVVKAVKKQGYKYYSFGTWYGATYKAPLADQDEAHIHMLSLFGKEKRLRGIEFTEFEQSPYFRLAHFEASWWPLKNRNLLAHSGTIDQLNLLDWATLQDEPGGRFIFTHMLIPHPPYYFNANGSLSLHPVGDNVSKPVKQKYIDQVAYINDQMERVISQIKQRPGGDEAIIIFSSDEGPYPQSLNDTLQANSWEKAGVEGDGFLKGDMRDWPDDWLAMKFGILQAVHIPKATNEDLEHLTSPNVFRIVLNRYFGYDLDYLPQCHLAFSDGGVHEFKYADITKRLNPALDDTECAKQATQK